MACVGVFVAYLPVTTVSVSLPAIQRALNASTSELSWVSSAFVLPVAALILTSGVFGDVHGRKKVFQAGLAFCALGATVSLSAQSVQSVWAGQALSGVGSAALQPMTLALISHAVPDPRERGKFIGLWATSLMAALAVGPLIAGLIVDHFAWRWIFLPTVPVALLVMALSVPLLRDSRAPGSRRLDWPGQITAALAVTALVYGVIEGGAGSFADARVMVALSVAAVALVAFVLVEKRSESPMLDLSLFRSPAFTATTVVIMITFLGLIGFFFVLSLYFGTVQHLSTLEAGLRLLMVTLVPVALGGVFGRLSRKVSARVLITGGLLVTAAALLSLTTIDAVTSFGSLAWRLALLGLGLGTTFTAVTATAVASVPHHLAGMAAAGNNAFRQVGGALGPAVLGTLLTTKAVDALPGHLAGVDGTAGARIISAVETGGFGAVARMDLGPMRGKTLGALSEAFVDGLHLCLIVSAALMLLAAVISALLLRRTRQTSVTVAVGTASNATPTAAAAAAQERISQ
ncbi:MFS transporter [Streptomyces sp. NBC_01237]|uniref:MFS transporter n=1 Tax=Streptomyces sp. NBC_01237 TaxID=2903790 RepID=UPI002DDC8040|nr:MFS transporter [Streptomyces sp. NBC_01237]WRZ78378.1 MFS transporter [Streptomyces sp. NBC_01237]